MIVKDYLAYLQITFLIYKKIPLRRWPQGED